MEIRAAPVIGGPVMSYLELKMQQLKHQKYGTIFNCYFESKLRNLVFQKKKIIEHQ